MAESKKLKSFESALAEVLNNISCTFSLKMEQKVALEAFMQGKDVFAMLPTGFGKSFIYQLAPLLAKTLGLCESPVVIIVSPLVALMEDQVREATSLGIPAAQLDSDNEANIKEGKFSLLFGSPESWLSRKWRDMLAEGIYRENLFGIVVDEVHLTYKWGKASKGQNPFRETFNRLGELRAIVKPGTPVLALTASANLHSRALVRRQLHLDNATTITASPNRKNIRLGLRRITTDSLECLDWLIRDVKDKGLNIEPILIYCRTMKTVGRVFSYLKAELGEDAWVCQDHTSENLIIGMFHSQTLPVNKSRVLSSLSGKGNCRVVVATTALGVGLNFPNISNVIMYGIPEDVEAVLQQLGRAGRNGSQSHSVVYATKQNLNTDEEVRTVIRQSYNNCFRIALFSHFDKDAESVKPGHYCCTYCHSVCKCSPAGCTVSPPNYEQLLQISAPLQSRRTVSSNDRDLVRELLIEYRDGLVRENVHLFTDVTACTGFSISLIDAVVENVSDIFDHNYVMQNLPVFNREHGHEILRIVHEVFDDFDLQENADFPKNVTLPDFYFKGQFDKEDNEDDTTMTTSDSVESGISNLQISD